MKNTLKEYNRKRDFSQTSEPHGEIDTSGKFRFVIQKHAASHLHYDFRIEHKGVLLSWAVPKGLPYLNADKNLAMHVEDHPVSYFDFEGTIPEGNYGAGNVIVWDWGNYWVPHAENADQVEQKIAAGLVKGELKLVLNGKKVKGLFALVRFKKAGENGWLVIKDKDEYEGINFSDKEESVKSGKTLADIASGSNSSKTNNSELEFISPMQATLGDKPFDNSDYLFEPKFDGYRALAVLSGKVILYSRNGEKLNYKFPELVSELEKLNSTCILDGEITAYDKTGKASFQSVQHPSPETKLIYHVFDILNLNGISTTELPLHERKKFLTKVIKPTNTIKITDYVVETGIELFEQSQNTNEGIIAKRLDSKYHPGERSREWVKIKHSLREEFVIGGVTNPKGRRQGFGSLIVGYFKHKEFIYVGHIGTGFDQKLISTLMYSLEKLKRKDSPFANYEGDKTVQFWVEPLIVCEAKFAEWTNDGMIRQAVFMGIRTDKLPKQVNQADDILQTLVTNPTKVLWSTLKYTKLDLAKYYQDVSPYLLPYLMDRPQNLNRHPNGIKGISFYQKDIEFDLPDFAETFSFKRDKPKTQKDDEIDTEITYLVCQNLETLVFMANLGCIEINPWLSRTHNIESPDFLVFDIDPNDVAFEDVVKITRELYELLEALEIQTFVKTSGKRGIHLYCHLAAKYGYAESRGFAELIAKIMEKKYPQLISLERSPQDRKGKIYIDYLQNRRGQTTAAVYSARPSEHATVSTPIDISELNSKLDPTIFTIKNTLDRIDARGDLWEKIWGTEVDLQRSLQLLKQKKGV